MSRTTEFVLGLIGGIFGFGGALFAIFLELWMRLFQAVHRR